MSFFYDSHSKRPQVWTYFIFILLAVGVFLAFYLYGEHKAKGLPSEIKEEGSFEGKSE